MGWLEDILPHHMPSGTQWLAGAVIAVAALATIAVIVRRRKP